MTQFAFHTLNLPEIHRRAIGFERIFDDLNRTFSNSKQSDAYPPYNIVKLDDTHFVIEVAVAGFAEEELDVELKDSVLIIKGKQSEKEKELEYTHKGISTRAFERTFTLAENVIVQAATVKNGILAIALENIIPEEKMPRKIAISFAK